MKWCLKSNKTSSIQEFIHSFNTGHSVTLSNWTMCRKLQIIDINSCMIPWKPLISKQDGKIHPQWCEERLHWTIKDWKKLCGQKSYIIFCFLLMVDRWYGRSCMNYSGFDLLGAYNQRMWWKYCGLLILLGGCVISKVYLNIVADEAHPVVWHFHPKGAL